MPREVFAEDIERFLGALDGVASVRVFTTPAGEVAQVYVTAEHAAEPRAVRRGVVAALVSTYGLPIEPWRVQVTQLRGGLGPGEIPRFRVMRVEETMAAAEMTAAVQLAWVRGGEERVATGRARGPADPSHRLRTLAVATIEAAREVLEPGYRRVSVQQASLVTFLDRPAALVGVALATPRGPETSVGVAQEETVSDAVVAAALDAVTKWMLRAVFSGSASRSEDRQERLEAMRLFLRSAERGGAAAALEGAGPSGPAGVTPVTPAGRPDDAPPGQGPPAVPPARNLRREPAALEGVAAPVLPHADGLDPGPPDPRGRDQATPRTGTISPDPDVVRDLSEIRPEKKGGAVMAVNQEPSRAGFVPRGGHASMEDVFYQSLVANRAPVHLRCRDGYELPRAILKDVGTYSLLVEVNGGPELVYKHAIISIRLLATPATEA